MNNVFPVASKLAYTSRSVRNRRNSIRKIHEAALRPVSDIDGSSIRSRRGQLPRHSVSSPSYCRLCFWGRGGEGGRREEAQNAAASMSRRLHPAEAYHCNIILYQHQVKVSSTWGGLTDDCCKSKLRGLQGEMMRVVHNLPNAF